jgi:hypothetical protein
MKNSLRFALLITVVFMLTLSGLAYARDNDPLDVNAPENITTFTITPNPAYVGQSVTYKIEFNGTASIRNTICLYFQDGAFETPIDNVGNLTSQLGDAYTQANGGGVPGESTTNCGSVSGYYVTEWTTGSAHAFIGGGDYIEFSIAVPNTTGTKTFVSQQYNTSLINTLNTTLDVSQSSTAYVGDATGDCGGSSPCYTGTTGLQDAINAIVSPGTIIIGGQYHSGGANVGGKNITLQPLSSSAELRADAGCGGGAPIVLNGSGNLTTDGLTLNGTGAPNPACADGVLVAGSGTGNLTIQNSGNSVYGWPSDGIEVSPGGNARIVIDNSSVRNNTSDGVNMNSGVLSAVNSSFSNNGGSGISANGGTVTVENSTLSSNTNGVYNNGAALTLRGNTIENNSSRGFTVAGGTNVAYANNFNGNNGGGFQAYVGDLDDAAKNWWGSHTNSAVGPTTDNTNSYTAAWDVRLGAAVDTWAAGTDSVTLGSAQLTRTGGSTADGVIISFGRASANAPFGNGVPPYVNQACSPFYDFYALGSPTNWRITLPIDNTSDCNSNVLTQEIAFTINNVAECSTPNNSDCWDRIDNTNILVDSNTLLIDNLDLSGTHIVSGDSSGGLDPTAINLLGSSAAQNQTVPAVLLAVVLFGLAATGIAVKRRRSH